MPQRRESNIILERLRITKGSFSPSPKTNMIYAADEIDLLARSETKLVELIYTQASMYCVLTYTSN
jgi:hypothetical protein